MYLVAIILVVSFIDYVYIAWVGSLVGAGSGAKHQISREGLSIPKFNFTPNRAIE